jgi:ABC-type transport system substrate-binding protein
MRPLSLFFRSVAAMLALAACAWSPIAAAQGERAVPTTGAATKVLRYAFPIAETGFDPAQVTDLYSNTLIANIFEAPYEVEFLASPSRIRPNTAAAMPEISADFKRWVITLKPGIFFADDPVFKGAKRELTAADYVYAVKRHYDPKWKSGQLYRFEGAKILGLSEVRKDAIDKKQPFDYDREVEGLRALDRYRFEIRFAEPNPRYILDLADPSTFAAIAREVVEHYGDTIMAHPVGTGPFMLKEWRRSSKIVLERNPGYRDVRYAENPPADDPRRIAIAKRMAGQRLPMIDRVEVSIIEETQPRWLSFLNEEHDVKERIPDEFCEQAIPNNQLAPHLAKRGIEAVRYARADASMSFFNMEHPVVGGYTPEKVALRRAISLAVDIDREIRIVRRGQAIAAQSVIAPNEWGYDPAFKSEMSTFDRARAKALLDLYGYVDRDGDGWREQPDGRPLELEYATSPDKAQRDLYEQWQINMDAIGIRMKPLLKQWPEHLKASRAGKLMMWGVGWSSTVPDGEAHLLLGYGPNKGQSNHARFDLPAFNALFEKQKVLPNGPERQALIDDAKKLLIAFMPYRIHVHRIWTDTAHPWVKGYHRNIFVREFWKYVDVDMDERAKRSRR